MCFISGRQRTVNIDSMPVLNGWDLSTELKREKKIKITKKCDRRLVHYIHMTYMHLLLLLLPLHWKKSVITSIWIMSTRSSLCLLCRVYDNEFIEIMFNQALICVFFFNFHCIEIFTFASTPTSSLLVSLFHVFLF